MLAIWNYILARAITKKKEKEGKLLNPKELLKLLERSWSAESSADPEGWMRGNPAWGQCAVTALVVQDFLGGEIERAPLDEVAGYEKIRSHYRNRLSNGAIIDFTESQFDEAAYRSIPWSDVMRTRKELMDYEPTRMRFARLRLAVADFRSILGGFDDYLPHPFFSDPHFVGCCAAAQLSGCQKWRVGCIAEYEGRIVASGANVPLEPLKHLCEPECIRFNIPSRTESMLGACCHAEEYVLDKVRELGIPPNECSLYVAGFDALDNTPHSRKHPEFTCLRCATQLYRAEIGAIYVPFDYRWVRISAHDAVEQSVAYAGREKEVGVN